jgi:hypothetical protein
MVKLGLLANMRLIGVKCPRLFAEYRPMFEDSHVAALKEICRYSLDDMDGKK